MIFLFDVIVNDIMPTIHAPKNW